MENEFVRMVWAQTWQVTLLILLVAAVGRCFGRNHPHLAHALWVVVLLKALTPPVWSSPGGVFSRLQTPALMEDAPVEPQADKSPTPSLPPPASDFDYKLLSESDLDPDLPRNALPPSSVPSEPPAEWEPVMAEASPAEDPEPVETELTPAAQPVSAFSALWKPLAIGLWFFGSLGSLSLAWVRWLSCRREIHRAEQVQHPQAQQLLEQLRTRLRIRRPVGLIISKSRIGPAVLGIFRPTILIPSRIIEGKTPADLEPILAHELIHVRRGDLWVGWLQVVVQSVWWFHPLIWWSGRLLKREAERSCDEEVVAELGCKPARYARALLDVLELKQILKPVPVLPSVKPVEITSRRLERIMLLRQGCRKRTPWWCWLVMLLTAALTLPGAAFVAAAKDKTKAQTTSQANQDTETLQSRTYKVGEVLEQIQTAHPLQSKTEARRFLIQHLKSMTQFLWDQEAVLVSAQQVGTPSLFLKGNKLIVRHSPAVQNEIANQIELLGKHGFQEIRVETRFITVNPQVLEKAVSDWQTLSPEIPPGEESGSNPTVLSDHQLDRISKNQVKTLVEKSEPLKLALLTESQSKKVIEICQGDARSNMMFCPAVTLFNGQSANVQDTVQRPFVVGVDAKGQPKIRVISEGISLKLRPTLEDGQIHLESQVTASDIRSVSLMDLPKSDKENADITKVQVPEVTTMRIDVAVNLKAGTQVLLGGIKPPHNSERVLANGTKVGQPNEQLFVMLKVYRVDSDQIASPPPVQMGKWEDSFATAEAKAKKAGLPILLHFRADWCGPCQRMDREVFAKSEFRELLGSKILGVKIDVDQHRELSQRFDVHSLPTNILISPEGKERKRSKGVMAIQPYVEWIQRGVSASPPKLHMVDGVGVKSDAGVTGDVVLGGTAQSTVIEPPTDEEVLEALDKVEKVGSKVNRKNIRIRKEKISQSVSPPKVYPKVGPAQELKARFKCTVDCQKTVESEWPIPFSQTSHESAVVYLDTSRLVRVRMERLPKPVPLKSSAATSAVLPAGYLAEDVQYFPPGPMFRLAKEQTSSESQKPNDATVPPLPKLVEKFNSLFGQKRYAEARDIGLQAFRAYPKNDTAKLLFWKARFALKHTEASRSKKETGWVQFVSDDKPEDVQKIIERKLDQKVSLKFEKSPLSEVVRQIATQNGINVVVEKNGLAVEGVPPDEPVTLNVEDIKLSSALSVLLKPLNLNYLIEDEVLKITGKTAIETRQLLVITYPVADLLFSFPKRITADMRGKTMTVLPENAAAQNEEKATSDKKSPYRTHTILSPNSRGKARTGIADFDELEDLIESTVEPDSWASKGGYGTIRSYETTLSLVIRQNRKTHEKIRNVLAQLRRLRDVQVTLGVRTLPAEDSIAPELRKILEAGKAVEMDPKQAAALQAKAGGNKTDADSKSAKVVLSNKQSGHFIFPSSSKEGFGLDVFAIPSADRRFVRLQLEMDSSDPKQKKSVSLKSLQDGHSLLVEIDSGNAEKKLILLTPRIIVQEEEEVRVGTVSPNIIVQEEEEELLGIGPKK